MSEPYLGQLMIVGFNFAPRGWANCSGQLLSISTNSALFSLLGTTYGGDGRSNFALPDLRGRFAMHEGSGAGLTTRTMGERSGAESTTLTVNQIPSHTHALMAQSGQGNQRSPGGNVPAMEAANVTALYSDQPPNVAMDTGAIQNSGGTQAHSNMNPFLVLRYCIALQGIFPSSS